MQGLDARTTQRPQPVALKHGRTRVSTCAYLGDGAARVASRADEAADQAQGALADERHDREQSSAGTLHTGSCLGNGLATEGSQTAGTLRRHYFDTAGPLSACRLLWR